MTIWWCERCHASGLEGVDAVPVWDAVTQLETVHDRHALATAQRCTFNIATVRVQKLKGEDEAEA